MHAAVIATHKSKTPTVLRRWGLASINSLTMTYFHTGIRTIIGADAFHCPVRDGKEWYHLAIATRQNLKLFAFNTWKKFWIEIAL